MIRRGTLIVLAILILLIGATWYLEWSPAGQARVRGTPTATAYPTLINLGPGRFTQIEMKDSSGTFGIQLNLNNTWSITDAQNTPVDQGKVQQLLSSLTGLQATATLDINALSSFGLVTANQVITIDSSNGTFVLKVGKVTPTNSGYYVQVDNHAPVVVDKNSLDSVLTSMNREALLPATATPLPAQVPTGGPGTPSPQSTATP
jgi:hypothetical protein